MMMLGSSSANWNQSQIRDDWKINITISELWSTSSCRPDRNAQPWNFTRWELVKMRSWGDAVDGCSRQIRSGGSILPLRAYVQVQIPTNSKDQSRPKVETKGWDQWEEGGACGAWSRLGSQWRIENSGEYESRVSGDEKVGGLAHWWWVMVS